MSSDDYRITCLESKLNDLEGRVNNPPPPMANPIIQTELDCMYVDPYSSFVTNLALALGQRQKEGYNDLEIDEAIKNFLGSASNGRLKALKEEVMNFKLEL